MYKARLIGLLLSVTIFPACAFAADLAPRPIEPAAPVEMAPSWAGFYVGANAGYAFGNSDKVGIWQYGTYYGRLGNADAKGVFGGAQAGYNYQIGGIVVGVETDFQGAGIKGNANQNDFPFAGYSTRSENKIDWFGTLRPRVGYAFGNTLIYATGGLAYGQIKYNLDVNDAVGGSWTLRSSKTRIGWTAGAGVEQAITDHWTVKAEYLYTDFGSYNLNKLGAVGTKPSQGFSMVRLGVNYKF